MRRSPPSQAALTSKQFLRIARDIIYLLTVVEDRASPSSILPIMVAERATSFSYLARQERGGRRALVMFNEGFFAAWMGKDIWILLKRNLVFSSPSYCNKERWIDRVPTGSKLA